MFGTVNGRRASVLGVLVAGAMVALMAFGAAAGQAAPSGGGSAPTAEETQELEATINSQVTWGSANGCEQNIKTNNFGNLVPNSTNPVLGAFDAVPHGEASEDVNGNHVWVGCVTTNETLASVEAQGTTDMSNGSTLLPLADVGIGITNSEEDGKLHGGEAGCIEPAGATVKGPCTLETGATGQTLVTDAEEGTTELDWQYQLNLPANQPVGSYTGGLVTFTATA